MSVPFRGLQIVFWAIAITIGVHAQTIALPDAPSASSANPSSTTSSSAIARSAKTSESYDLQPGEDPQNRLVTPFLKHLVSDQENFWTSPARLQKKDFRWIVPFTGITGGLIAGDGWISRQVPDKPSQLKHSQDFSNYAVYSLVGAAGGSYLLGHFTNNEHLREAGFLSGEAAVNSTAVTYAFKSISQRPRPMVGNGNGTFFEGGTSFPSEHAAVAWSVASVWAHEYPGPLSKLAAYGLASAVTLTRITGKQHFASDAVIGSALGWYFGRQAYRAHHDMALGGSAWGDFVEDKLEEKTESTRNPENMGSPYVPLDSWVYPIFERLAALGVVQSGYFGIRPWTRMECARLLEEAGERLRYDGIEGGEAEKLYTALAREFTEETARLDGASNLGVSLDSVYTRVMGISGTPLRDGYHFGQTIINDFGRPYAEGLNTVSGITAHAVAGPFSFYVRGEYQHSPAVPTYPDSVLQATAASEFTLPLSNALPRVDRFRILDSAVTLNIHNIQISFGKQSTWLGPGESGPFLSSNNAEPVVMLRIDNVSPFNFPLLSRWLGPARMDFAVGQLSGQPWVFNPPNLIGPGFHPQPFVHENKISFKPTPNLEFGLGVTAIFGGPGLPFTWHNFLRTYYAHNADTAINPGKRFSGFDISYRIPGLRKWLTFYNDSLTVDEISPIGSTRPLLSPGLYLPQLPKLPKMELRVEALKEPTSTAVFTEFFPGYIYFDRRYRSGYTNNGNLIGSWIGRAGLGGQAWAKYSFSPRTTVQVGYRHQEVDHAFIGGGRLNDFSTTAQFMLSREVAFSTFLQYEQWKFPVLSPGRHSNVTASVQLVFYPNWRLRK
jgi:membrane-associated phospholipid phosphatase